MATSGQRVERVLQRAGLLDTVTDVAVACTSPGTGVFTWTRGGLGERLRAHAVDAAVCSVCAKQLVGALAAQQVVAGQLRRRLRRQSVARPGPTHSSVVTVPGHRCTVAPRPQHRRSAKEQIPTDMHVA